MVLHFWLFVMMLCVFSVVPLCSTLSDEYVSLFISVFIVLFCDSFGDDWFCKYSVVVVEQEQPRDI